MRINSLLRQLIGIRKLFVQDVRIEDPATMVAIVRPSWRRPRCGECGTVSPGYDRAPVRRWRHLNVGAWRLALEYQPRRVFCGTCEAIRTECVPWAEHGSWFTREFEELTAYLVQITDKTQVSEIMGISWPTVGTIVRRVVDRKMDPEQLEGLRNIGVDEFSYRKFHRYLTVVVDHDRRRIVWAGEGRDSSTLGQFFDELGEEGCEQLEHVTIDMAAGFIKAIQDRARNATIVFDRFHVQQLASKALDEVRREQWRDAPEKDQRKGLFKVRYSLLKNPWDLSRREAARLADVERTNRPLFRAYLLKEHLARALDYRQPWRAKRALRTWLAWASRSRLKPFVRAARTIRKHFDGIVAYIKGRLTNAFTEGINTRLRMIARRAYGFHSASPLIAMLFLCCGGITLSPPLPRPTKR